MGGLTESFQPQLHTSLFVLDREKWISGPDLPENFDGINDLFCIQALNSSTVLFLRKLYFSYFDFKFQTWLHLSHKFKFDFYSMNCLLTHDKKGQKIINHFGFDYTHILWTKIDLFSRQIQNTRVIFYETFQMGTLWTLRDIPFFYHIYNSVGKEPIYKILPNGTFETTKDFPFRQEHKMDAYNTMENIVTVKPVPYYVRFYKKVEIKF